MDHLLPLLSHVVAPGVLRNGMLMTLTMAVVSGTWRMSIAKVSVLTGWPSRPRMVNRMGWMDLLVSKGEGLMGRRSKL